ncbi:MAG: Fpg/Nei family DNA glycosylase [Geminicoccaceae bacterium]
MPELPDVELFRRTLDAHALRRTITRVVVSDARILGDPAKKDFAARLKGNRLEASRRHGKHLLVQLAHDGWLTLHFGMTGNLRYVEPPADDVPYDRVRLGFAGGSLVYVNERMLGRVGLADDADAFVAAEGLGPDALDPAFDLVALSAALDGRREVKAVLMDQSVVAGIGNLYADEILFQARLHPRTPGRTLGKAKRKALSGKIREVLEIAIDCGAGAERFLERLPKSYLLPQRHDGGACPRCNQKLATLKAAGRTSYYCPRCQPEPA